MAMVKCKECGNEMSSSANACPKCGKVVKRTSFVTKLVLGLFVIAGVIMVKANMEAGEQRDAAAAKESARVNALTPGQRQAEAAAKHEAAERKAKDAKAREEAWQRATTLAHAIRSSANDPKSIEIFEASYTPAGAVYLQYRGKNAFNATIVNQAVMTKDGQVANGSDDKVRALFNKHIAGMPLKGLPKP